jgi:TolA-binding protein
MLTLRDRPDGLFLTEIPGSVPLSAESQNILRNTQLPQKAPLILKSPRVFSVDLTAPTGGEESALFQIISDYFVNFEWESARISLQHYLSLPRSREIEIRARFYFGQTLYYTGSYREALMEFLYFRSLDPSEANRWIDAVLTAMVH